MMAISQTQVYCEDCGRSYWLEFGESNSSNGIFQRSLIHNDHVLVVDIDKNGVVRKSTSILIEHDPMASERRSVESQEQGSGGGRRSGPPRR